MKNFLFSTIIIVLLVVTSCNDQGNHPDPIKPKDTLNFKCPTCPEGVPFDSAFHCPLPYDPNDPNQQGFKPIYEHEANGPSAISDLLSIGQNSVLNLKTLQRINIDILEFIPKDLEVVSASIRCFSPRNNSQLLFSLGAYSINDEGKKVYGKLIYIVDILTKESINVTPSKFGKAGEEKYWGYSAVNSWSYDESTKTDRLHFSNIHGTYIVQEDRFIDVPASQTWSVHASPDNKYRLTKFRDYIENINSFSINGVKLPIFDTDFRRGYSCAWSKDSRYLAIAGSTSKSFSHEYPDKAEWCYIWVFDLLQSDPFSSTFTYKHKINLRKQFCKYLWPEGSERQLAFISPNTLAVSLQDHTGGGAKVHEITIDGKYVRQLTFEK